MLAYVFWHTPLSDIDARDYEKALVNFHADMAAAPPPEFEGSAAYKISNVPWLNDRPSYEDWCFVTSSKALDTLNHAAVKPERWDVHAAISSKTDFGHGGLYYPLHSDKRPIVGTRVIWLKRPRGIRYEKPLQEILDGAKGALSCWRKLMVLGPGDEFAIIGTSSLEVTAPAGWQTRIVDRRLLTPIP